MTCYTYFLREWKQTILFQDDATFEIIFLLCHLLALSSYGRGDVKIFIQQQLEHMVGIAGVPPKVWNDHVPIP